MVIGVPREIHRHEHRVGLTPFLVARLVEEGHEVMVETKAGLAARFADEDYEKAGARVVYSAEEVYQRADLVCRMGVLSPDELSLLKPETVITGFQHLAVAPKATVDRLMALETTLIGYEVIRDRNQELPVLLPFSSMAGNMAVHLAANLLQNDMGGRGILLGNIPGVPPPTVLILGAGIVGRVAAKQAAAAGCHVIVLDADLAKLRLLNRELAGRVVTVVSGLDRLESFTAIADVLIGSVLIPGGRPPMLVTEKMVQAMKPGSVIVDISIDQGGCVETSRPTTLDHPTYVVHDVVHYCVPNMTASIARTASRALANAALPYLLSIADRGLDGALREDPGLARGVYLYRGHMVEEAAGRSLGFDVESLDDLMKGEGA